ncbi:MAG: hypothetical protein DDT22_01354 [candidate division WS2 bacterium]|nr:hypothetical protein [Candidatus Lithacetigena glycinireducens]
MISGIIGDIVLIIYLLSVLISLVMRGLIHPYHAVFALLLLVFLRAKGRLIGGALGSLVRGVFTIALPIMVLAILAIRYSQGDLRQMPFFVGLLAALFLTILGLYIMVWGAFSSPKGILWSLPVLLSIMIFISDLALRGYISPSQAGLGIVLLVLLRGIGNVSGKKTEGTARQTFKVSLPLASLAVFILIFLTAEARLPLEVSLGMILPLAILFIVFYLIVLDPFKRR